MTTRSSRQDGFTLVELLVVIAIIGILVGMLLPAVQSVRGAARRAVCQNNLRQIGLGILNYESARNHYPPGSRPLAAHSWCTLILPHVEQKNLFDSIDLSVPWNAPQNLDQCQTDIVTFVCPSSQLAFDGKMDYGGIIGSILSDLPLGSGPREAWGSGVLIRLSPEQPRPIRVIRDGASNTLIVGESVDREPDSGGIWADGLNVFSHDNGPINGVPTDAELRSWHPSGAHGVFADGSVHMLSESTDLYVIGAISTRNGGEKFDDPF
jgi:prepilin-type N-terminal cleavage/methylation domain-containing protein